eukprot:14261275-Ditylum_brightwellii.AAC.2
MQRRPHQRGNPQKTSVAQKGASAGVPLPVFGGEGRQQVLVIDKGNITYFLKSCNKAQHCFYIS